MEKYRPTCYVSGPMTVGDWDTNIRRGIDAGEEVYKAGFLPFIPHCFEAWGKRHPKSWEDWMEIDLQWVEACDALLRIPGESKGADIEVAHALKLAKPVAYAIPELVKMFFPQPTDVIELPAKSSDDYWRDWYKKHGTKSI